MQPLEHPDHLLHQQQARAITRGSRQAADDKAMEAMYDALDAGKSKEEAEKIFQNTYKLFICASKEANVASSQVGTTLKQL